MKGDIHSFHMRYNSMISTQRLQRNIEIMCLNVQPLVHFVLSIVVRDPYDTTWGLANKEGKGVCPATFIGWAKDNLQKMHQLQTLLLLSMRSLL